MRLSLVPVPLAAFGQSTNFEPRDSPFPMEVVEDRNNLVLVSETEHSVRIIPHEGRPHAQRRKP